MKTKILKTAIFILTGLFIFACSDDSSNEPEIDIFEVQGDNGFVGTLNGTNAFVALLIADNEAVVYLCNGDEDIYEWFRGAISKPEVLNLTNSAGGKVSGNFTGDSFDGEVILSNGNKHVFSAISNTGNKTGIFRIYGDEATEHDVYGGWIVNSQDEERGFIRMGSIRHKISIREVPDGSSNTILIGERSFLVGRFFLRRFAGSASIIAPNNIVAPNN